MDLYLVTDHNSGYDQEYSWWRTEKSEDMFHVPGFFVTFLLAGAVSTQVAEQAATQLTGLVTLR